MKTKDFLIIDPLSKLEHLSENSFIKYKLDGFPKCPYKDLSDLDIKYYAEKGSSGLEQYKMISKRQKLLIELCSKIGLKKDPISNESIDNIIKSNIEKATNILFDYIVTKIETLNQQMNIQVNQNNIEVNIKYGPTINEINSILKESLQEKNSKNKLDFFAKMFSHLSTFIEMLTKLGIINTQ